MIKKYIRPEMEITKFSAEDVITASSEIGQGGGDNTDLDDGND